MELRGPAGPRPRGLGGPARGRLFGRRRRGDGSRRRDADERQSPRSDSKSTSLVPADPFRRYLAEVRKYPPLSREEEQELARRYRDTGDREALAIAW